eukprot:425073_1
MESIRVIKTATNYERYIRSFYIFDCMLSGMDLTHPFGTRFEFDQNGIFNVSSSDIEILNDLIDNKLHGTPYKRTYDPYILDTFNLFCFQKEEISIRFPVLDKDFSELSFLIAGDLINYVNTPNDKVDGAANLLKPHIFKILPNIKRVTIQTTSYNIRSEYAVYKFVWSSFLSFIESGKSSVIYQIRARRRRSEDGIYSGVTWLEDVDCNSSKWTIHRSKEYNPLDYQYAVDILRIVNNGSNTVELRK